MGLGPSSRSDSDEGDIRRSVHPTSTTTDSRDKFVEDQLDESRSSVDRTRLSRKVRDDS